MSTLIVAIIVFIPISPCACITQESVAEKIFGENPYQLSETELQQAFIKLIPLRTPEEKAAELMFSASSGECKTPREYCELVIKESLIFKDSIEFKLTFSTQGIVNGASVIKH